MLSLSELSPRLWALFAFSVLALPGAAVEAEDQPPSPSAGYTIPRTDSPMVVVARVVARGWHAAARISLPY